MYFPYEFEPPVGIKTEKYTIRKLTARDLYIDYFAVMSSIDIIQKTRGGSWPDKDLTIEEDLIDLGWHQREFENGHSFAYTIVNPAEDVCLGCCYFYPTDYFRPELSKDYDIEFSFWVTKAEYDKGFYNEIYNDLISWIKKDWSAFRIKIRNNMTTESK